MANGSLSGRNDSTTDLTAIGNATLQELTAAGANKILSKEIQASDRMNARLYIEATTDDTQLLLLRGPHASKVIDSSSGSHSMSNEISMSDWPVQHPFQLKIQRY